MTSPTTALLTAFFILTFICCQHASIAFSYANTTKRKRSVFYSLQSLLEAIGTSSEDLLGRIFCIGTVTR